VVELLNPNAEIRREVDPGLASDNYHSDGKGWDALLQSEDLALDPISNQIMRVAYRK
jgi:hypothetical protein